MMKKYLFFISMFFSVSVLMAQDTRSYLKDSQKNTEYSRLKKEIWTSLRMGHFELFIAIFKGRIKNDPQNLTLRFQLVKAFETASNFYKLLQDEKKVLESFENEVETYKALIEISPHNFKANYELGALYFRKGVDEITPPDSFWHPKTPKLIPFSLKFDESLPYFQKAESLNPNDLNTVIALSEIYGRKGEDEIYWEMKRRKELLMAGGKISKSFFERN